MLSSRSTLDFPPPDMSVAGRARACLCGSGADAREDHLGFQEDRGRRGRRVQPREARGGFEGDPLAQGREFFGADSASGGAVGGGGDPAADPPMGRARARGVLFASRNMALVCVGQGWYQVRRSGAAPWKLGKDRPELPLAYCGAVSRLAESIAMMIGGKEAVITVLAHGADNEGASFDLALNRSNVPGLARVQRIRRVCGCRRWCWRRRRIPPI